MLGCFSRLRRPPSSSSGAPAPLQHPSDDASTSAASTSTTSPRSSFSSARFNKNASLRDGGDADGAVAKESPSSAALSVDSGLSSAIASRRFFLSSPGRSNSIVDSKSAAHAGMMTTTAGVAVPTYSPDPHADFLRSMVEMSAALRLDARRQGDRARLHELLLCYLALNDKRTHRYVVSAFTDLLLRLTAVTTDDLDLHDDERHAAL
uniref:Uncharacterized protein n=1 Tax=Avena sativa TaxID=4498 RepID=A0ACD5WUE7_AVESA